MVEGLGWCARNPPAMYMTRFLPTGQFAGRRRNGIPKGLRWRPLRGATRRCGRTGLPMVATERPWSTGSTTTAQSCQKAPKKHSNLFETSSLFVLEINLLSLFSNPHEVGELSRFVANRYSRRCSFFHKIPRAAGGGGHPSEFDVEKNICYWEANYPGGFQNVCGIFF